MKNSFPFSLTILSSNSPCILTQYSVYEKLFETSDIMSDAFEICVGHFRFVLDIFLFDIKTLDSVITRNCHIVAKIRDI